MEEVKALQHQKMITVNIKFFTNEIPEKPGHIKPKHAWTKGMLKLQANASHSIKSSQDIPFNSLMELTGTLERVLTREGITLHIARDMGKYLE